MPGTRIEESVRAAGRATGNFLADGVSIPEMRRWLPPIVTAAIAAVLMLALVPAERVPAPLLRLICGGEGSTALMLRGGWWVDLDVIAGDAADAARGLERVGFDIRSVSPDSIQAAVAYEPEIPRDDDVIPITTYSNGAIRQRLMRSGRYWPFALAVIERAPPREETADVELVLAKYARSPLYLSTDEVVREVANADLAAIRHGDRSFAIELARPELADAIERELAHPRRELAVVIFGLHDVVEVYALGRIESGELRFAELYEYPIDQLTDAVTPSLLRRSLSGIAPTANGDDAALARALLAAVIALLIFVAVAIAGRRGSRLESLIRRDDTGGGRGRVAASVAASLGILGFAALLATLEHTRGPFMAPVEAGLLGDTAQTTALDIGFTALMAGFTAAMIASLLHPTWRRDVVCDPEGGRRLMRRGVILAAVAGFLLFMSPDANDLVNVLFRDWSPPAAMGFAAVALALVAALVAIGTRAVGGPFVITGAAVLAGTAMSFADHLDRLLRTGAIDGGKLGAVVVAVAALAAFTVAVLSRRLGDRAAPLRAPVGGLLPVALGLGFALLIVYQYLWGWSTPSRDFPLRVAIALPVFFIAAAFELRVRRGLGSARIAAAASAGRRGVAAALALSGALLVAVLSADVLAVALDIPSFAVLTALSTAAVMDLGGELRARWRRPTLRPVWHIHQPQLAGLVERALESRGVSVHLRGRYLRTCLGIFGAFIPITAMVDRDRADEARHLIRSVLG